MSKIISIISFSTQLQWQARPYLLLGNRISQKMLPPDFNTIFQKNSRLKRIILSVTVMFFALLAHSQSELSFCTFVSNQTQECVFENTKFITTPDSTHARLFMILRSNETFDTTRLTFQIFSIDRFGNEVFFSTVPEDVQATWRTAWQPTLFTTPGKYIVKVYGCDNNMITTRRLELFNN